MAKNATTVKDEEVKVAENKGDLATQPQGGALATRGTTLPAGYGFEGDEGKGMENVSREEQRVTYVKLLQSNSPEVEDGSSKQIPGARAGMFLNTSTGDLYPELVFVPARRDRRYVEFTPRDLGGGFLGVHDPKDAAIVELLKKQNRFGKLTTTTQWSSDGKPMNGTEFIETCYLFGVFAPPGTRPFEAILNFKSTQITKYQTFINRYLGFEYRMGDRLVNPPIWAHRWLLRSGNEQKKGKNFKGYVITLAELNEDGSEKDKLASLMKQDDPLYQQAKALYMSFENNEDKAAAAMAGAEKRSDNKAEEEIPM